MSELGRRKGVDLSTLQMGLKYQGIECGVANTHVNAYDTPGPVTCCKSHVKLKKKKNYDSYMKLETKTQRS